MFILFVGDVYESLAIEAKSQDANAVLITQSNVDKFLKNPTGVAYTSLADVGNHELFFQLCNQANKIYYRPPVKWSNADQKYYTEHVLAWASQHLPIDGFGHLLGENKKFSQDFLQDTRKTDQPQLWAAGCSITFGTGVDIDQTYRKILSCELNLQDSNLSWPGSSIIWQSDQICRADIRFNDTVVWGLTGTNRLPVFHRDQVLHLNTWSYDRQQELKEKFPIDILDNDTLFYHNILAVRRAYNFCHKIGAKLVILGLMYDVDNLYLNYCVPAFKYITPNHREYVDLGSDSGHPGPEQHKIFAKEFLDFFNRLYQ